MEEITAEIEAFWLHLGRAAELIGQERPFSAHGELEVCRAALLHVYQMALAPEREPVGWAVETLPGAAAALAGLQEWLVCPLQTQAMWRCAMKLATGYERLMLPLAERLGAPYPYERRTQAFAGLEKAKRRDSEPVEPSAVALPAPALPLPAKPAGGNGARTFRIRRRDGR